MIIILAEEFLGGPENDQLLNTAIVVDTHEGKTIIGFRMSRQEDRAKLKETQQI